MTAVAGVEIGGTKVVVTVGTGPRDHAEPIVFPTTSPAETMARIVEHLSDLRRERPFDRVGVASFGPIGVDPGRGDWGRIGPTPKPGWSGAHLIEGLSGLGVPIRVETDVNAAAAGELAWGAGRGLSSLAYVTVGTGVGIGLVIEGRPVHGLSHPEAGHIMVRRIAEDVYPGRCPWHQDCLEGLISGPALTERRGVAGEDLEAEDPVFDLAGGYLGMALASIVLTASPERVIVGGGVGQRPAILSAARTALFETLNGYVADMPAAEDYLVAPGLGAHSGLFGALAIVRREGLLQSFA